MQRGVWFGMTRVCRDGFDVVGFDHRSMYSIVLFLNDCEEGGAQGSTRMSNGRSWCLTQRGDTLDWRCTRWQRLNLRQGEWCVVV